QVYFIDNEDYFQRKNTLKDENGKYFEDNDERTVFFARGVLETVKKLRWTPDIIHCHGWFTSLVPLYIKKAYNDDPLFANSKVVYSVYDDEFNQPLKKEFKDKIIFENINQNDLSILKEPNYVNLSKLAIEMSDATIIGSETINPEILSFIKNSEKPYLDFQTEEEYIDAYSKFYDKIL
ncbi:MAG: glycogen/starch synthase, partial [Bacteroidales bacterium]|nr:glycogen/starch synthase [Bacteroidales bacterium]